MSTIARTMVLLAAICGGLAGAGCTHAAGKLPVDNPKLMKYEPPDIDELTGVESSDDEAEAAAAKDAAQKPQK